MAMDLSRKARNERSKTIIANIRAMMAHEGLTLADLRVKHMTDKGLSDKYDLPSRFVIDRTFGRDVNQTTKGWPILKAELEKSLKAKKLSKKTDKVA